LRIEQIQEVAHVLKEQRIERKKSHDLEEQGARETSAEAFKTEAERQTKNSSKEQVLGTVKERA
jgi:hypothetical protein